MDSAWLYSTKDVADKTSFDEAQSKYVTRVAAGSPAEKLGLAAGDYLLTVNHKAASSEDLLIALSRSNVINYSFFSQQKQCVMEVECSNIPLGFVAENSSQGIVNRYRKEGFYDWPDLVKLWQREEWSLLLQAAQHVKGSGLVLKLIRLFKPQFGISGEVLFEGAALYEQGHVDEGIAKIKYFIDEQLSYHTTDFHAIAFYYQSLWHKEHNNHAMYLEWLERANNSNAGRLKRINDDVLMSKQMELAQDQQWLGKNFPSRFVLPLLEGDGLVSLQNNLDDMDEGEVLPVCVMPSYRGNGPYDECMLCYRVIYKFISTQCKPLIVITDQTKKRADRSWWYQNEAIAKQQHIDFSIAYDENSAVPMALMMTRTPIFYVLNKQGVVIYEGTLNEAHDYWDCLNQVNNS